MTNRDILEVAMKQSAIDLNCDADDFLKNENVIVTSEKTDKSRKYLQLPFDCNLVSYGNNIVASVSAPLRQAAEKYISLNNTYRCFETPYMNLLSEEVQKLGYKICFMAEYFLPDVDVLKELPCNFETKLLTQSDFQDLYLPQWSNALCETRKELDVIGVGAYDGDKLVGLAACSADCDTMYQIGVDVLSDYRKMGIASSLTSKLAIEILKCGKVPFYCAAWSNIRSIRNAVKSFFRPTWVELTVKSADFVDKMNRQNECR